MGSDDRPLLGKRVRTAREAHGLSQERLAVTAGVSSATVARIELGLHRPHRSTLALVAAVLGLDVDDLLGEAA